MEQEGRDKVYTRFNSTAARNSYPMRCVQNGRFGYIFNAWVDGETFYKNESMMGLAYQAMCSAGEENEDLAARVRLFHYRGREEFYDFARDPDALHNLADAPEYREQLGRFRGRLLARVEETGDPLLSEYRRQVTGT